MEEGETVQQAALRELREETNVTDCQVHGESASVYEYTFPQGYRRFRPDNVKGQQIHFIFATAAHDVRVTVDGKEIDAYQWIDIRELGRYVKRKAYATLIRKLYDEARAHRSPPSRAVS